MVVRDVDAVFWCRGIVEAALHQFYTDDLLELVEPTTENVHMLGVLGAKQAVNKST
ncbi:hypothetical protein VCRA2121O127_100098 [Vibrio crassostreae]|nr:hypothetical protein VCRA2114E5_120071 [Vibrio crassostreae]CAK2538127.1 hypothetical protein VCRA2110O2_110093 [Vibrio crassostreae]CAK3149763.1 hypothetical protein VCRA2121O127_100098 [Vibrio crassostreae]CDT07245.1 hypothetical protein VCRLGP7_20046 [Vibrio crassostreae]